MIKVINSLTVADCEFDQVYETTNYDILKTLDFNRSYSPKNNLTSSLRLFGWLDYIKVFIVGKGKKKTSSL